ncbi:MAG: hypothetical protein ACRD1K_02955, partial [Acidimicrobiales bacterium]
LAAAAVAAVVGVAALVVTRPDGAVRVGTTPAQTGTTPNAPGTASTVPALWPATTDAGLAALQAEADAGRRTDLLDPQDVAGRYLNDRYFAEPGRLVDLEVQAYRPGDGSRGEVPYVVDGLPGTVVVRRLGGERGIWYVAALTHLRLPLESVGYDAVGDVTAEVRPTAPGKLEFTVTSGSGSGRGAGGGQNTRAGELVGIGFTHAGPVAMVQIRLTGDDGRISLAEFRLDRSDPTPVRPAYCGVVDALSGERPDSYEGSDEHLADIDRLLAAAPPQVVADLRIYRDYVADHVDPAVPASHETGNWPPAVRATIGRIVDADARLCRGSR